MHFQHAMLSRVIRSIYLCHLSYYNILSLGIYFCFISLSTVGFGDIVPTIDNLTEKVFSFIYMFYNVIGLTVVSCFITSLVNSMEDINLLLRNFKEAMLNKKFIVEKKVDHELAADVCTTTSAVEN